MSNLAVRRVLNAGGGAAFVSQLNGPVAWNQTGGSNAAIVQNRAGDLRMLARGGAGGLFVQADTGHVGIGNGIAELVAPKSALDVSGDVQVSGDVNFLGTLYQNGELFAGHLWTVDASGGGIVGYSNVGIQGDMAISGEVRAASFIDGSGNEFLTTSTAEWSAFEDAVVELDDGTPLSLGVGGGLVSRYLWFGGSVSMETVMIVGTGASLGIEGGEPTQGWAWTLPTPAYAASLDVAEFAVGTALMRESGAGSYVGEVLLCADGRVKVMLDGGNALGASANAPFAWRAGDSLALRVHYEATGRNFTAAPSWLRALTSTGASQSMGLGLVASGSAPKGSFVVAGALAAGGISAPAAALDVSGDAAISGWITANTVSANTVSANTVSANTVSANTVSANTVSATDVSASVVSAADVNASNVNFTGLLLQGGVPYVGSQWTTSNGWVTYGSNVEIVGDVSVSNQLNANVVSADVVNAGTVNFTDFLLQDGVPYVGSQWTTSNGWVTYGSNVAIFGRLQVDQISANVISALDVINAKHISASIISGACISDSFDVASSTTAASVAALSNVFVMANATALLSLPRTGGTVTGALSVVGTLYASNVAILGSLDTINAYQTNSSNVVINNLGTGPALSVSQTEYGPLGPQPVARFICGSNVALVVASSGFVGVGQNTAAVALDVSGSAQVSGTVLTSNLVSTAAATIVLSATTISASNVSATVVSASNVSATVVSATVVSAPSVVGNASSASRVNSALSSGTAHVIFSSTFDGSTPVSVTTDATATNVAGTLVSRDASGNFAASTVSASLQGTATRVSSLLTTSDPYVTAFTYDGSAGASLALRASSNASAASQLVVRDASANIFAVNMIITSDQRAKRDISNITNALDKIQRMNGVTYTFKNSGVASIGLIAQNVQQVVPEVVHANPEGFLGVSYGHLVGLLVEGIKDLSNTVQEQALHQRVLEQRVQRLETLMDAMVETTTAP